MPPLVALQINTDIIQRVTLDVSGSMQSQEVVVASLGEDGYSFQAEVKYDDRIIIGKDLPLSGVPKPLFKAMNGERGRAGLPQCGGYCRHSLYTLTALGVGNERRFGRGHGGV